MNHEESAVDQLRIRVRLIESSVRRWRAAALASVLLAVLPWAVGAACRSGPVADLRVSSLTLVGPDGAERATLRLDEGAPVLTLRDAGRYATLTVADGSAGLACGGPQGVTFAGVSLAGAYFNARGTDLKTGVFAGVAVEGDAAFRAFGSDMKVAAALESDAAGSPLLRLSDPKLGETRLPEVAK